MSERKLYAAYGSNMNLSQMAQRCPHAKRVGRGLVYGYELVFAYKGVATIVPSPDNFVIVILWELTPECEQALDRYEGYPRLYGKEKIQVSLMDSDMEVSAMAYVMNKPFCEMRDIPSESYKNTILIGLKQNDIQIKNGGTVCRSE